MSVASKRDKSSVNNNKKFRWHQSCTLFNTEKKRKKKQEHFRRRWRSSNHNASSWFSSSDVSPMQWKEEEEDPQTPRMLFLTSKVVYPHLIFLINLWNTKPTHIPITLKNLRLTTVFSVKTGPPDLWHTFLHIPTPAFAKEAEIIQRSTMVRNSIFFFAYNSTYSKTRPSSDVNFVRQRRYRKAGACDDLQKSNLKP